MKTIGILFSVLIGIALGGTHAIAGNMSKDEYKAHQDKIEASLM
jgi:hypothetical protein